MHPGKVDRPLARFSVFALEEGQDSSAESLSTWWEALQWTDNRARDLSIEMSILHLGKVRKLANPTMPLWSSQQIKTPLHAAQRRRVRAAIHWFV